MRKAFRAACGPRDFVSGSDDAGARDPTTAAVTLAVAFAVAFAIAVALAVARAVSGAHPNAAAAPLQSAGQSASAGRFKAG